MAALRECIYTEVGPNYFYRIETIAKIVSYANSGNDQQNMAEIFTLRNPLSPLFVERGSIPGEVLKNPEGYMMKTYWQGNRVKESCKLLKVEFVKSWS